MSFTRRIAFSALALLLGTAVAVVVLESALRFTGHRPWTYAARDTAIPIMFEPDPTLGWTPKPGTYVLPIGDASDSPEVTIRADRTRDTGLSGRPRVVAIGCSYTFGWGVADTEAFPAKLQHDRPEWQVMNAGVPAYGAYQALLWLERLLASGIAPQRVLYGYMEGHELRNIAHPAWTYQLEKFSTQGMIAVPYATLGDHGALVRHAPQGGPNWPLRTVSAIVPALELGLAILRNQDRIAHEQDIADRTVLDMAALCRAHGIEFVMVALEAAPERIAHYAMLLGIQGVRVLDCALILTPDLTIPHEGHPNAEAHRRYAECIERDLG